LKTLTKIRYQRELDGAIIVTTLTGTIRRKVPPKPLPDKPPFWSTLFLDYGQERAERCLRCSVGFSRWVPASRLLNDATAAGRGGSG
jgi:hypothetical protein